MEIEIDEMDRSLLKIVQEDARLSFREVARRVGMSTPAVAERIRKLEGLGVISGYAARVERAALGQPAGVMMRVEYSRGRLGPRLERLSDRRWKMVFSGKAIAST